MSGLDGTVVITGEALIDLVLARDGSLDGHPGGGPYNVARTIGRLGSRCCTSAACRPTASGGACGASSRPTASASTA